MSLTPIQTRLQALHARMEAACLAAGREADAVKLILAIKTQTPEAVAEAVAFYEGKMAYVGENKVQEGLAHIEALPEIAKKAEWHHIGQLQTNKVKEVLRYATVVQSVDRLDLAEKLAARVTFEESTEPLRVLVQVNTSGEETKAGCAPDETLSLCRAVAVLPQLKLEGLMTIGALSEDEATVRACFKLLRTLSEEVAALNLPNVEMRELSMGMSGDLEWAIAEGATMVRVGSAIFGARA